MPGPLSFVPAPPAPADVPILGQLVKIDAIALTVSITCKCESPTPLLLTLVNIPVAGQGQLPITCPSCHRSWGFAPDTNVHINIAQIARPK